MRILNQNDDKPLNDVLIVLKKEEASELIDTVRSLLELKNNQSYRHEHINDEKYEHELTVVIYDQDDNDGFSERIKMLISRDE